MQDAPKTDDHQKEAAPATPCCSGSDRNHLHPCCFLFLICLGVYLFVVSIGWSNPILGLHGFRETQTALTAYHAMGKAPKLAYETPVLGPPWSIPFELPLYQWIVAAAAHVLGTPLDQTGRFINVLFFLLTFIPAYFILGKLHISRPYRWIILALLAVTPQYLHYTRTFMMESHALFLGMCYLAVAFEFLDRPKPISGIAGAILGCLAALVKITTFTAFLGAVLLVYGIRCARELYSSRAPMRLFYHAGVLGLLVAAPVLATYGWTACADGQKELNPFGGKYLASYNLRNFTFGTLQDRRDLSRWRFMAGHVHHGVNGYAPMICFAGFALASAAWLFRRWQKKEQLLTGEQLRRRWLALLACILLFLTGPLIFFNLYFVHEYYWCANSVFLIAAMGICVATMIEMGKGSRVAGAAILLLVITGSLYEYSQYYYCLQTRQFDRIPGLAGMKEQNDDVLAIAGLIEKSTRPEELLVCLGHDWHSDLAYYSRRRTIAPPNGIPESLEQLIGKMANIQGETLGALVIDRAGGEKFPPEKIVEIMEQNGFQTRFLAAKGTLDLYALKKVPTGAAAVK